MEGAILKPKIRGQQTAFVAALSVGALMPACSLVTGAGDYAVDSEVEQADRGAT
jgi:hypothetical protein